MENNRKYNVTYILGAGASAKALPTVKERLENGKLLPSYAASLQEVINDLEKNKTDVGMQDDDIPDVLIREFQWLIEQAREHNSIDGYCMHCCSRKMNKELERAKNVISTYFIYMQFVMKVRDNRYLKFLNELTVHNDGMFPKNVKIINWNYDFQMQLAAEQFKREHYEFNSSKGSKHTKGMLHYYPCFSDSSISFDSAFQMIHMNGIAGFFYCDVRKAVLSDAMNLGIKNFRTFIKTISQNRLFQRDNLLTFAFEKQNPEGYDFIDRFVHLKKMVANTHIVVVIGYSFDSPNQLIDAELFKLLNDGKSLQKIYIQNPSNEDFDLLNRFDLEPERVKVFTKHDCTNFFVPFEVNKSS